LSAAVEGDDLQNLGGNATGRTMTKVTRLTIDEGGGAQSRRIHLREISGDLDAPLETVGQDLRTARLRRGDDLASVSRVLKIRKDHLEALEEDRLDALPGRTYAVGFVRSYAEYLGLDSGQCVERFKAEIAGRSEYTTPVQVIEEDDHRRLPQGWMLIAGVVLLLLAYGAYHLIVSADEMLSQPVTPAPPQAMEAPKAAPKQVVRVQAPPPSNTAPVQTPAIVDASGTVAQQADVPPAANPSASAQLPPLSAPATGTPVPSTQSTPGTEVAALPPGEVYGQLNKNSRVVLRVHETTRILVMGPGKTILINRTLRPGDTYQVPNMVGLTLTTPDGGAVEVDLDGAAMGFAGKSQQMTDDLSLDPQTIVDRYNGTRG
jgi:cytoskeleton protein RodZ